MVLDAAGGIACFPAKFRSAFPAAANSSPLFTPATDNGPRRQRSGVIGVTTAVGVFIANAKIGAEAMRKLGFNNNHGVDFHKLRE